MKHGSDIRAWFGSLVVVVAIVFAHQLHAQESSVEALLKALGETSFVERQKAREGLKRHLEERPEEVAPIFEAWLETAEDPEIRLSLKALLKSVGHGVLVATYTFDEEALEAGEWTLIQAKKGDGAIENGKPVFSEDGVVEIDSRKDPKESFCFTRPIMSENAKHRTVFEAKVKIIDPGAGGYCAVLTLEDDVHGENLVIDSAGVDTYNRRAGKAKMETVGVWKSIRIEAEKGVFRVFADDAKEAAIAIPWTRHARAAPKQWVRFGDTGSRSGARVHYKDIKVSVYEIE